MQAAAAQLSQEPLWSTIQKAVANAYNDIDAELVAGTSLVQPPLGELRAGHFLGRLLAVLKIFGRHSTFEHPQEIADMAKHYLMSVPPTQEGILEYFASISPQLKSIRQNMRAAVQEAINGQRHDLVAIAYVRIQRELSSTLPRILQQLCERTA